MKSINMQIYYYWTQHVFHLAKKCAILLRTSVLLEIDKDFYLSEKTIFYQTVIVNSIQLNKKKTFSASFHVIPSVWEHRL